MSHCAIHKSNFTRILAILFTMILMLPLFSITPDAKGLSQTVDIASIKQNQTGEGYSWLQRDKTMTFDNLSMDTKDDCGFHLPPNATIVLKGDNVIKAKSIGITGLKNLSVTGSGTLTIYAEIGIKMLTPEDDYSLTMYGGKVKIYATSIGIQSDSPHFILGDCDLDIEVSEKGGKAISAYTIQLNNGSLCANAPIVSRDKLECGGCDLTVEASSPALVFKKLLIGEKNEISVGDSIKNLKNATEYKDQNAIRLVPTRSVKESVLLGASFPYYFDYLLLSLAIVSIVLLILLPILFRMRRRKARMLRAQTIKNEYLEARREEKKAQKKQRRGR